MSATRRSATTRANKPADMDRALRIPAPWTVPKAERLGAPVAFPRHFALFSQGLEPTSLKPGGAMCLQMVLLYVNVVCTLHHPMMHTAS